MNADYKLDLENKLKETDYSQLPDVNLHLNINSKESFTRYRNLVRNELLEITSNFNIETIPTVPAAIWDNK